MLCMISALQAEIPPVVSWLSPIVLLCSPNFNLEVTKSPGPEAWIKWICHGKMLAMFKLCWLVVEPPL